MSDYRVVPEGHINNFAVLRLAARKNDLALVNATDKQGNPATLICALYRDGDGSVLMTPLAVMIEGDWEKEYTMTIRRAG